MELRVRFCWEFAWESMFEPTLANARIRRGALLAVLALYTGTTVTSKGVKWCFGNVDGDTSITRRVCGFLFRRDL